MISLDDEQALRAGDPSGLLEAFLSMPGQLLPAYRSGAAAIVGGDQPASIAFCGMGGSGAAGDAVAALLRDVVAIPMSMVRGPTLPGHCGKDALVICLSYSGGTEETLSCYREARKRGCLVAVVAADGPLAEAAERDGAILARVRGDVSMPRAALGSLVGGLLGLIEAAGIDEPDGEHVREAADVLRSLAGELGPARPTGSNEAKALAAWVGDRTPVIWGSEGLAEPAALRWKAAFNENAKVPAFASALPELTHHEVVGWSEERGGTYALLVLRHDGEHPTMARQLPATLDVVGGSGLEARQVFARGRSKLARLLSLELMADAASTYHALMRGVDPTPIEAIARIKDRLR